MQDAVRVSTVEEKLFQRGANARKVDPSCVWISRWQWYISWNLQDSFGVSVIEENLFQSGADAREVDPGRVRSSRWQQYIRRNKTESMREKESLSGKLDLGHSVVK